MTQRKWKWHSGCITIRKILLPIFAGHCGFPAPLSTAISRCSQVAASNAHRLLSTASKLIFLSWLAYCLPKSGARSVSDGLTTGCAYSDHPFDGVRCLVVALAQGEIPALRAKLYIPHWEEQKCRS